MCDSPTADHPPVDAVVDLVAASTGGTVLGWVEAAGGDELVVSVYAAPGVRPAPSAGERIDVVWRDAGTLRALPTVLTGPDPGERDRWRLRPAGAVTRGQRRDAVRAPLRVPIVLGPELAALTGTSIDLSESGLRCLLERIAPVSAFVPPESGEVLRASIRFPDLTVTCLTEVVRRHPREDERTELSLRFIGLREHAQDDLRRRVFARLRDLRQRGLL